MNAAERLISSFYETPNPRTRHSNKSRRFFKIQKPLAERPQQRFARQLAAGQIKFFDHGANREMITRRAFEATRSVDLAKDVDELTVFAKAEVNAFRGENRAHNGKGLFVLDKDGPVEIPEGFGAVEPSPAFIEFAKGELTVGPSIAFIDNDRLSEEQRAAFNDPSNVPGDVFGFTPAPGDVVITAETPHGLKDGDLTVLRALVTEQVVPAPGGARERLKRHGYIEFVGRRWIVRPNGAALLRDPR